MSKIINLCNQRHLWQNIFGLFLQPAVEAQAFSRQAGSWLFYLVSKQKKPRWTSEACNLIKKII
jgi:hypothetical protein